MDGGADGASLPAGGRPHGSACPDAVAVGAPGVLGRSRVGRGPAAGGEPLAGGLHPEHRRTRGDERAGQAAGGDAGDEDDDREQRQGQARGAVGLADVPAEDRGRARAGRGDHARDPQQLGRARHGEPERGERRVGEDVADGVLRLERAERGDPLPRGQEHHHRGEHDDARGQADLGRTLLGGLAHRAIVPSRAQLPPSAPRGPAAGFLRVVLRGRRGAVPDVPDAPARRGLDP